MDSDPNLIGASHGNVLAEVRDPIHSVPVPPPLPSQRVTLPEDDPARVLSVLEAERRTLNHLHLLHASEAAKVEAEGALLLQLLAIADPALANQYSATTSSEQEYSSGTHFFNHHGFSVASYEHYNSAQQLVLSKRMEGIPSQTSGDEELESQRIIPSTSHTASNLTSAVRPVNKSYTLHPNMFFIQ